MNSKNTKKSLIHVNADADITCNFGDGDISRLGVAYLTHVYIYIHNYLDYIKIGQDHQQTGPDLSTGTSVIIKIECNNNERKYHCTSEARNKK